MSYYPEPDSHILDKGERLGSKVGKGKVVLELPSDATEKEL